MEAVLAMQGLEEESLCGQKSCAEPGMFQSYTLLQQLQSHCAADMNHVHKEAQSTTLI